MFALATPLARLAWAGGSRPAAPGDLDPTFDGDGKRVGSLSVDIAASKLLEQPDGKIIVIGRAGFGNRVGGGHRSGWRAG